MDSHRSFRPFPPWRLLGAATLSASAALTASPLAAQAAQAPIAGTGLQFSGSGFYTVVAAKALRVRQEEKEYSLRCDCFIAEYSQGGVHEDGRIGWRGETKLGLQGQVATADGRWSLTGQAVARGARDGRVNVEWLYLTREFDHGLTVQAGRQRLPLLSMSAVQDVGLAFPWVRLPMHLYGWDIVNYNGLNAQWRGTVGPMAVSAKVYAGGETIKDSAYQALYYEEGSRIDTRWSGIRGLEFELGWGDFKLRGATLKATSSNRFFNVSDYPEEYQGFWIPEMALRIATVAVSAEPGPWLVRAEYLYGNRRQEYGTDRGWLLAFGRRFGDLQLVFTRSMYRQTPVEPTTYLEDSSMNSVVLRWDVTPGLAWKLQYDDALDESPGIDVGSRRMLSIAVTGVF